MAIPYWNQKRAQQGYSYPEIVTEIRRRASGNYLFSKKENSARLKKALREVAILYKLSANLHDFFEAQKLDPSVGLNVFGDSAVDDAMRIMLDPFPKGNHANGIEVDGLIDLLYPGNDFEVERGITLVFIKKTAK